MSNETEKLTINLGVVELAQVDVLVEQGLYANRSDLIRTAIRKQLETHKADIERSLIPIANKTEWAKAVGIWAVNRETLEEWTSESGEKLNISVIGMLILSKDISLQLFEEAVGRVIIRGKIIASDEIKEAIKKMN